MSMTFDVDYLSVLSILKRALTSIDRQVCAVDIFIAHQIWVSICLFSDRDYHLDVHFLGTSRVETEPLSLLTIR